MKKTIYVLVLLILLSGCQGAAPVSFETPVGPDSDGSLRVTVSIAPQKYFVERISGELVDVTVMVQPGNNPATYEPKPEQLTQLSESAAYFAIGVPFEDVWLDRITAANSGMVVVDTAEGIERLPMETAHAHDDDDSLDDSDHGAGALDPHIWLSPELVKIQSQSIYHALADIDPDHEAVYRSNLDAFVADIDILKAEIAGTLAGVRSRKFMVFHPSWGYFARDFGLEMVSIEIGGQEPSAQELARLVEEARKENIRVILAQPEFNIEDAETIAQEIGGEVLLASPLAEDWLSNLQVVADTFAEVLSR
ncbi:MAG: zinc ABC transporter substrate-binding protein [Anaerolineae bacterium]|nr:zinc ABC transporter substrate-binding protein [Anaerolineae bacterium]